MCWKQWDLVNTTINIYDYVYRAGISPANEILGLYVYVGTILFVWKIKPYLVIVFSVMSYPVYDAMFNPVVNRKIDPVSTANVLYRFMFFVTDVIGVCKSVDEVTRLTTKSNREVSKRTLNLMDMSGKVVTVTLWGEEVSIAH